jgi:hypothetical protein
MCARLLRYLGVQGYMWNSYAWKMALCYGPAITASCSQPQTLSSIVVLECRCRLQLSTFLAWLESVDYTSNISGSVTAWLASD